MELNKCFDVHTERIPLFPVDNFSLRSVRIYLVDTIRLYAADHLELDRFAILFEEVSKSCVVV